METGKIVIKMMGSPQIAVDGAAVRFPFRHADALIYYLAVNKEASKAKLCDLLWGDRCTDEKAKSNLRNTVYVIRKQLGADFITEPARQMMALNKARVVKMDVTGAPDDGASLERWEEFLRDFYLKDNDDFNSWAAETGLHIKNNYCKEKKEKITAAFEAKDFSLCRSLCGLLADADRYDEFGWRYLLLSLGEQREYALAAKSYEELKNLLWKEFLQEPEEETQQTALEIKNRRCAAAESAQGVAFAGARNRFFYGREAELNQISRALRLFIEEVQTTSFLVRGEMGIGKSTLMERAVESVPLAGCAALISVRCYQAEETFLLKLWYDLFEQLLQTISHDASAAAQVLRRAVLALFPSLDSVVPPADEPFTAGQEYFLVKALVRYCANNRLILKIDDIQWADPASLALIRNIVTMDKNRTILFVMGCRNDQTAETERLTSGLKLSGFLEECELRRFTPAQTADFAQNFLPDCKFDAAFNRAFFRETEGNPLFITEMLNNISFSGSLAGFTPKLGDVIRQRILSIDKEALQILELISMMPDGASFETLSNISRTDERGLVEILERLIARKFIFEETGSGGVVFSFTHQKIMEYVYEHISFIKRRLLHENIALYFESILSSQAHGAFVFPKLIYHFEKSRLLKKYLEYVIKNIIGYLNMAQEYFPTGGSAAQPFILSGAGGVSVLKLNNIERYFRSVEQKITENLESFNDEEGRLLLSEFYNLQGRHYTHNLNYSRAAACIAKIKELNEECGTEAQRSCILKANYHLSSICMDRMDIEPLLRAAEESLPLVEEENGPLKATWLRISGMSKVLAGRCEEALSQLREAEALFVSFGDAQRYRYSICACYSWMGEACRKRFDFDGADVWHERAVTLCEGAELLGGAALFYTLYAQSLADRCLVGGGSRLEPLGCVLQKARSVFDKFHLRWYRGTAFAYSALAAYEAWACCDAAKYLTEARTAAEVLDSDYERCVVNRISAQIKKRMAEGGETPAELSAAVSGGFIFYKESAMRIAERLFLPIESEYLRRL